MNDDIIIDVKNVWKSYGLPPLLPWKKRQSQASNYAIRDVSFQVRRGGSLGILGRNGAGKSTLLKLLAGVTPPDKGSITVGGRIFPMIELNAGISMELTGRENITLLATIMGFSGRDIRRLEPEIMDFSELEDWIDRPVWQYSSGMLARLAFGIAVHARADILLVDEVLSTGDILFQRKCQLYVQKLLRSGTTLLFVSHSPYQVEKLCERAILLEKGQCLVNDIASKTMQEYLCRMVSVSTGKMNRDLSSECDTRPGTGDIRVVRCFLTNSEGQEITSMTVMDPVTVNIVYKAFEDVSPLNYNVFLFDANNTPIAVFSPSRDNGYTEIIKHGSGILKCHINALPVFGMGLYFSIKLSSTYLVDSVESAVIFDSKPTAEIAQRTSSRGLMYCEHSWEIVQKNA